jgi:hypothetical protein
MGEDLEAVQAGRGANDGSPLVRSRQIIGLACPQGNGAIEALVCGFPKPQPRAESFSLGDNYRDIGQLNLASRLG